MTEFTCPTRIISGVNALDYLKTRRACRVLVVTDSYFSETGKALAIGSLVPGAEVKVFDEVIPDPPADLAAKGAVLCNQWKPDLLIALGGGSPMDCAKAIGLASEIPMAFIAIPTTTGSGSEVTSFAILTHGTVKEPLVDDSLRPEAAILDPGLVADLPKGLLAHTAMDLLAHCVEALGGRNRSSFTDALAIHGARTVLENLAEAYTGSKAMMGALQEAACMAGLAFDRAGLGLCHAAAHVLGGAIHLPHGQLCAMLLPHVMEVNAPAAMEQYGMLARSCGIWGPTDRLTLRNLTGAICRLRTQVGIPSTLKEAGKSISGGVVSRILADPCCRTNPVSVTEEMVERVLKGVAG